MNITPVFCRDINDIVNVAEEMRALAIKYSQDMSGGYNWSKTDEELEERVTEFQTFLKSSPKTLEEHSIRLLAYKGLYITIGYTLDKFTDKSDQWHLSMSHPANPPKKMNDFICKIIADAFFIEGYQEIQTSSVAKGIRHFVKDVDAKDIVAGDGQHQHGK